MRGRLSWKSLGFGAALGLAIGFVAGALTAGEFFNYAERVLTQRALARRVANLPAGRQALPEASLAPPETPLSFDYRLPTTTVDGSRFNLAQFKGRVLVANVWAAWCVPCLAEMPAIEALAARFHGDDHVAFVLISKDTRSNLERYLSTHGKPTIPIALLESEVEPPGAEGIVPVTFIVAPDGDVKVRERGAAKWDSDKVASFIRTLEARPS